MSVNENPSPLQLNGHSTTNGGSPSPSSPASSPASSSSSSPVLFPLPSLPSSLLFIGSLLFLWLSLDPHRRPRHLRSMLTFGPSALANEMSHLFLLLVSLPAITFLSRRLFSPSSPSLLFSPTSLALFASLLSQSLSAVSLTSLLLRSFRSRQSFHRALLHPASLSPAAVDLLRTPAPKSSSAATSPPPLLNPMAAGKEGEPVGGNVFEVKGMEGMQFNSGEREEVENVGSMSGFRSAQLLVPLPALARWKGGIRVDRGLTFHIVNSGSSPKLRHLQMDVYHPTNSPLAANENSAVTSQVPLFPLVVNVHGGGWITGRLYISRYIHHHLSPLLSSHLPLSLHSFSFSLSLSVVSLPVVGDKSSSSLPLIYHLAQCGIVIASINYRLAPHARHPSQLIDIKRALHFLRTNAAQLHVDPSLVFLAGDSAGAHLASLAALTAGRDEYQPGFEGKDVGVVGVIDLYGVHSFMKEKREGSDGFMHFLATYVMAATIEQRPELYRAASPVFHLQTALKEAREEGEESRVKVPWFFCAHGVLDTLVPIEDSLRFFTLILELRQRQRDLGEMRPPLDVCVDVEGASHAFNLLCNARTYALSDAIVLWMRRVIQREGQPPKQETISGAEARRWIQQRTQRIDLKSSL